jgi:heat shock protein HslJ
MKRFSLLVLVLIVAAGVLAGCRNEGPQAPAENAASAETAAPGAFAPVEETAPADEDGAAGKDGAGLAPEFLTGHTFKLAAVNGVDFTAKEAAEVPTLAFGEGLRISGRICNLFNGPGRLENGRLTVKPMVSTRMACLDESLGQLETLVTRLLENGADLFIDGSSLSLRRGDTTLRYEADPTK